MDEHKWLAEQFEGNRAHLRAVVYRMLGSQTEADDAVQESWIRLSRSDTSDVENLGGWLTTVVARVCLDMLRSRESRREESLDLQVADPITSSAYEIDPEHEVLLADSVGLALLVVVGGKARSARITDLLFALCHDVRERRCRAQQQPDDGERHDELDQGEAPLAHPCPLLVRA